MTNKKQNFKETLGWAARIIVVLGLITGVLIFFEKIGNNKRAESDESENKRFVASIIKTVSAKELYSMFKCPCCGKSIEAACCGMAKERKAFVDGLTETEISEKEAVSVYVKKYGLNSFVDQSKKEEFRQELIASAPADRPIIAISPAIYDFGDVSQKEGITTAFFELENKGKQNLVINNIETSCGCTSAAIVYQGEEGPKFSMPGHGINEKIGDWQVSILPGEIAQIKAYYDPNMHGDLRGDVIRSINVFSNDPIDFEKTVQIELNQVD